jgi:putative peptidoglycan lipid II flippase
VIRLCALVIGGMVVYFAVLFALGFRVRDFRRRGA